MLCPDMCCKQLRVDSNDRKAWRWIYRRGDPASLLLTDSQKY
ncbi:hypothetical protein [Microcoleus sp. CAWBG58]|nr:hypothetical protein [Microcoleus sp. CAWBG58]